MSGRTGFCQHMKTKQQKAEQERQRTEKPVCLQASRLTVRRNMPSTAQYPEKDQSEPSTAPDRSLHILYLGIYWKFTGEIISRKTIDINLFLC